MTQFDWQTDEDDWEGVTDTAVSAIPSSPQKRRWIFFVTMGVLGIFLLAAGFAYAQIRRRVEVATTGLTDELLAVHTLLQDTAVAGDMELFAITLFPTNKWRETQLELLARQLFWNRSSLGLWLDLERFDPEDVSQVAVEYAPDLQRAEVTTLLPYVIMDEDENLQSILLQKTAVYQQVDGNWVYAPFPADFWGEEVVLNGRILTINTPQRDVEISEKLLQDIDALIGEACALPNLTCPSQLQIELAFQTEPESSFELNQNYQMSTLYDTNRGRIMQIKMPAPTLVGLSVDEFGYEALLKGYAAQIITRIMYNRDSDCCRFGAHRDTLQAIALNPPYPISYHPQSGLIETPIPLPEQDIVALCQNQNESPPALFRYELRLTTWSEEYVPETAFVSQMRSAQGEGVLLATSFFSTGQSWNELQWVVNGEAIMIDVDNEAMFSIEDVRASWKEDSQDFIIQYLKMQFEGISREGSVVERFVKVDPRSCELSDACTFESLSYYVPLFSPARSQSMVRILAEEEIWKITQYWWGDQNGVPLVEAMKTSTPPVWMDEENVLFIELDVDAYLQTNLRQATFTNGRYQPERNKIILTSEQVTQFLQQEEGIEENFVINSIVFDSTLDEKELLLFASPMRDKNFPPPGYLLTFNLETGMLDWVAPFAQMRLMSNVSLTPNGRFWQAIELKDGLKTLYLFDVETGAQQSYNLDSDGWWAEDAVDWSQDGQWVLITDDDGLRLIAPSERYERRILSEVGVCSTAVWVDRN